MTARPLVVLDANVLYTFVQRGFFLFCAIEELFDPLWSDQIVGEATFHLREDGVMSSDQVCRLVRQMRAFFGDAWGHGFTGKADGLALPDEGDRHVVALAIHYEADLIVTSNGDDFPENVLRPHGIEPVRPNRFAEILCDRNMDAVFRAAEQHRCSYTQTLPDPDAYLQSLRTYGEIPTAADRLAPADFVHRARPCDPAL